MMAARKRSLAMVLIAAGTCILVLASGTWPLRSASQWGNGGGPMELESTSKAGALKRVSGVQMVKDVKKVLQDVESTLEARAARKKSGGEHRRPESADVKRNLNDVDHIMDGLEALVHRSSSGGGESSDNSKVSPKAVTDSLADSKKRSSRGRLAAAKALLSLPGGASKTKKKVKLDAKQLAIAAKMRALTAQISKDFKKVTGYGKQAGYVPPPKIPHV